MISYGSQSHTTAMSHCAHSHQLGEGQLRIAAMLGKARPSRSVYGSRNHNAAMPMEKRSHLFTRGRCVDAAMLNKYRLSREGSSSYHRNVTWTAPFLTSLREPIELRRNANLNYLPPVLGQQIDAEMLYGERPISTSFGPPLSRRKATMPSLNFNQRPTKSRRNASITTPRNQGDPIWTQDMKTRLSHK